jgi:hypothetical protein
VIAKAFRELFRLWGQLRHVTHEQPGLFRTEVALAETPSFQQEDGYDSVLGGSTVLADRLNVEQTGRSAARNRCFLD